MNLLMAVVFLRLKFITLSQPFNKSKGAPRPQRIEEVLLSNISAVLHAIESTIKIFPPTPVK